MTQHRPRSYNCIALAELTHQLLLMPAERRSDPLHRAERLHDQIEASINFPQDYLVYRITGLKPEKPSDTVLVGQAVLPDLRRMIDALSRSLELPITEADPAETAAQLARRLQVSTKTITRWRDAGLRWRWMLSASGRKRLVYPRRSVESFMQKQGDRVRKAGAFTQMDPITRRALLHRARRLHERTGLSLNRIATHLAHRSRRAVETLRLILQQHDREHPEQAIFFGRQRPLTEPQKAQIRQQHSQGQSVRELAVQHRRALSSIYRALREHLASDIAQRVIAYVPLPAFEDASAMQALVESPLPEFTGIWAGPQKGEVPEALVPLFRRRLLDGQVQRDLLTRAHALCQFAEQDRKALDPYEPRSWHLQRIRQSLAQAAAMRSRVVCSCMPLLLRVARHHHASKPDAARSMLGTLLEIGLTVLLDAVEQYDPSRRPSFESHLNWALMRKFASVSLAEPGKARRREEPEAAVERMLELARSRGIDLAADAQSLAEA